MAAGGRYRAEAAPGGHRWLRPDPVLKNRLQGKADRGGREESRGPVPRHLEMRDRRLPLGNLGPDRQPGQENLDAQEPELRVDLQVIADEPAHLLEIRAVVD